jgi:hypothetical protein
MLTKRLLAMICGTAACALAIGNFMQSTAPAAPASARVDLQAIELTSVAAGPAEPARAASPARLAPAPANAAAASCPVSASAAAAAGARVRIALSAPCQASQRVTVHHNGLMFTEVTDAAGTLSMTVPALSEQAVFIFELPDGAGAVAAVQVPAIRDVERVALQWHGSAGFEIHALENGAAYGQPGHIWSGGESSAGASTVVRLGNPSQPEPRMAEIYTLEKTGRFPADVALSVEAEVSQQNCGRDLSAQTLELRGGERLRTRDLTLAMPDCSAVGNFLVLNNLVRDLTIAAK